MNVTVGMKVKVVGRYADFTDHLDGQVVTVVGTDKADNGYAKVQDANGDYYRCRRIPEHLQQQDRMNYLYLHELLCYSCQ